MIKTEKKFTKFPAEYLLTEEAAEKATDLLLEKLEELGLIESYWVNYSLYWFCKNHLEHRSEKSCECCIKMNEKGLSNDHIAKSIYNRYDQAIRSTSRVISEKLQLAPLNHSFCDYFKNVSNNEISFSKKEGFYFNNINGGEFSFEPILGDCLNIFALEEKVPGFKRTSESIDIYNVILKTIKQYPKIIGNYTQKYEDINGNCVLLSVGGLSGSFYDKLSKFLDKFLIKVCKDGTLLNNQSDYIQIMKDELGDFFYKVHTLVLDFTREEIKKYFKFIFEWVVTNLYDLLNKIEEYPHNFIFKTDYEHSHKLFLIPGELKRFPFDWLPSEEQKFAFLSVIVFYRDGKIEDSNFKSLTSKILENKEIYLKYTKDVILERINRYYSYNSYQFRNLSSYIEKELEEIESSYKFILNLFKEKEDPELIKELNFAKEYLEILMENFKKELLNEGRVWFSKSSLKELKSATAEELEDLLSVITTDIDYSEINTVRKVARLIADSYFPIDFVDQFRKIYNQNLESYAFLSVKSKDEGNFEGSGLKIFAPLFRDEVFNSRDRYTNLILAFDKFYQKELGVPAAMINWLDELEYGASALTGLSIQYAHPAEEDLQDWNTVYNVGERVGELTTKIRESIYSKQKK